MTAVFFITTSFGNTSRSGGIVHQYLFRTGRIVNQSQGTCNYFFKRNRDEIKDSSCIAGNRGLR
jgi:hypothetical protein